MAREERVARPTRTDEWEIIAADKGVADEWGRWAKHAPNALATGYDQLPSDPTQFSSRQKRRIMWDHLRVRTEESPW